MSVIPWDIFDMSWFMFDISWPDMFVFEFAVALFVDAFWHAITNKPATSAMTQLKIKLFFVIFIVIAR